MDASPPSSPGPRPLWQRLLNRLITLILNTGLWFALWIGAVVGIFLLEGGTERLLGRSRSATWEFISELGVRAVTAGGLALVLLLMIHPIRTRWWVVGRVRRLARWLGRLVRPARPAQPAAAVPAIQPDSPRRQPLLTFPQPPRPMSRRRFLAEGALLGGLLTDALFIEPYWIDTVTVDIPVANLPGRFAGMTIAQVSDLHTNQFTTGHDLERLVDVINGLDVDLVTITGDFVDSHIEYAAESTAPFRRLRAREGVFSVLGNHDYYTGRVDQMKAAIKAQDLGLLVNQHTTLRRGADTLTIIGLDDPAHNRGISESRESVEPALAMLDRLPVTGPRLLMVHNPVLVPQLVPRYPLDLILAGHTHGGQFRVPVIVDKLVEAADYFVMGRYDLGQSQLYVNRGFGYTGPPVRLRARPEVTLLRLVPA